MPAEDRRHRRGNGAGGATITGEAGGPTTKTLTASRALEATGLSTSLRRCTETVYASSARQERGRVRCGLTAYLASPLDLLPGIPLDDIAFALLALALMVKLTPKDVLEDLLRRAAGAGVVRPP